LAHPLSMVPKIKYNLGISFIKLNGLLEGCWAFKLIRKFIHSKLTYLHHRYKVPYLLKYSIYLFKSQVTLELLGKCLAQHMLDSMRVRVYTTTQRNTLAVEEGIGSVFSGWTQTLLIPLILIATILLLITVLVLLCCAHHRRGKKGARINRRNEYTTKGFS